MNITEENNNLIICNKTYEMIIPLEYGLRIKSFKKIDGCNFLGYDIPIQKQIDNETWHIRGGHRLWHTPEEYPRTYMPDNQPIVYKKTSSTTVEITQPINERTNIQKKIVITFAEASVKLVHKIINRGMWPIETAAWAITILRKGGKALVPLNKKTSEYLSTNSFSLWPYASLSDERVGFYKKHYYVLQDPANKEIFKIGHDNEEGWAAYKYNNEVFIKSFEYIAEEKYPDNGCSFELYTNEKILELETLSPYYTIAPGECIEHIEMWKIEFIDEFTLEKMETLINR